MMDWTAAKVSLTLAVLTAGLLLPVGLLLARWLATTRWPGRPIVEALLLLPLLLPPTVLGFYFLVSLGRGSPLGMWLAAHEVTLVFSMPGLLEVSWLVNGPFMVQPIQRAFAAVPNALREAAWVSGLGPWVILIVRGTAPNTSSKTLRIRAAMSLATLSCAALIASSKNVVFFVITSLRVRRISCCASP